MKKKEAQKLYHSITNIEDKYIEEAQAAKKGKKPVWFQWGTAAACLCLVFVSAITISNIFKSEPPSGNEQTTMPDTTQPPAESCKKSVDEEKKIVTVTSLLASENNGTTETLVTQKVPIRHYQGIYEKVPSVQSDILSQSTGESVSGTKKWYFISGHTDMQYLIKNNNKKYSLWKFICFDASEYPYQDVLKFVYQIESPDTIPKIEINPATMDNTDGGKAMQKKTGTHIITDRKAIDTIYQTLSSMTCYGSNQWDRIDYGNVETPADAKSSSHQAVQLGRYLTIFTSYGNKIDGLKYTAVSDMFYEFSGIAYNRLSIEQAERIREILDITVESD